MHLGEEWMLTLAEVSGDVLRVVLNWCVERFENYYLMIRLLRRVRGVKDYLGYPHGRKTNGLQVSGQALSWVAYS